MLEFLMPERCAICARFGPPLCDACRSALVRLHEPVCERCGSPGAWPVLRCAECSGRRLAFVRARSAIAYDARARVFVREWKERGRRKLADHAAGLVVEVVPRPECEAIAYVPGDPKRARERGDVPPRGLARALGQLWERPVIEILRRKRTLPRQRGLTLAERRRNARGTVAAAGTAPASVALVDDVYTSGATADACAFALRRAGARRVEVVTLARAVR
ncbi:MAG: ComF family protein [Actinobacteria bacterium]|nr:MAG: ComF family protein [Actinomycetota bacterium]